VLYGMGLVNFVFGIAVVIVVIAVVVVVVVEAGFVVFGV
jgi:hypothetical protein